MKSIIDILSIICPMGLIGVMHIIIKGLISVNAPHAISGLFSYEEKYKRKCWSFFYLFVIMSFVFGMIAFLSYLILADAINAESELVHQILLLIWYFVSIIWAVVLIKIGKNSESKNPLIIVTYVWCIVSVSIFSMIICSKFPVVDFLDNLHQVMRYILLLTLFHSGLFIIIYIVYANIDNEYKATLKSEIDGDIMYIHYKNKNEYVTGNNIDVRECNFYKIIPDSGLENKKLFVIDKVKDEETKEMADKDKNINNGDDVIERMLKEVEEKKGAVEEKMNKAVRWLGITGIICACMFIAMSFMILLLPPKNKYVLPFDVAAILVAVFSLIPALKMGSINRKTMSDIGIKLETGRTIVKEAIPNYSASDLKLVKDMLANRIDRLGMNTKMPDFMDLTITMLVAACSVIVTNFKDGIDAIVNGAAFIVILILGTLMGMVIFRLLRYWHSYKKYRHYDVLSKLLDKLILESLENKD